MAITPYYLSLVDPEDRKCPVRKQAIPTGAETHQSAADLLAPLHEDEDSPVPGLTHRYPDRVLFLITDMCSMYCRHCTRRRFAGQTDGESHLIESRNRLITLQKLLKYATCYFLVVTD
jgi:lysine 2,3-aminomutase